MKMTCDVKLNLKTDEVIEKVKEAAHKAMVETVTDVANNAIKDSPHVHGHNRRSMWFGVGDEKVWIGESQPDTSGKEFTDFDPGELSELQGAIYSTSGYGGFLETGTSKMEAQPYIKPNADKYFTAEKFAERTKKHLND